MLSCVVIHSQKIIAGQLSSLLDRFEKKKTMYDIRAFAPQHSRDAPSKNCKTTNAVIHQRGSNGTMVITKKRHAINVSYNNQSTMDDELDDCLEDLYAVTGSFELHSTAVVRLNDVYS